MYQLLTPDGATELCALNGTTYVSVPDGDLPVQPEKIAASVVDPAVLTTELREAIKAASPHVSLIDQRVREKIAAEYPIHEEIKLLRAAPSAEFDAYNAFVESCRKWGMEQKTLLGL